MAQVMLQKIWKRVPFIPQMEAVECGAACLGMVMGYHGHHVPLVELRQACSVGRDGVTALAILKAARTCGFDAEAFRAEVQDLSILPLPAIIHWEFNHFVVLERLGRHKAVIVDPGGGRRGLSVTTLRKSFTGVALAFEPGPDVIPRPRLNPSLSRYRNLFHRHLGNLGFMLSAALLLQIAGFLAPIFQQFLMDRAILPKNESWLWGIAIATLLSGIVQMVLGMARSWVVETLQTSLDLDLSKGFVQHLSRLSIGFFLARKPGDLLQRLESNSQIRGLLTGQIVNALLDTTMVLGYGLMMVAYHPTLASVVIGFSVGRMVYQVAIRRITRQLLSTELSAGGDASGTLLEAIHAVETVKAAGAELAMVKRYSDRSIRRINMALRRRRIEIWSSMATTAVSIFSGAAIYALAGSEVMTGVMTLGTYSAFLSLQGLFSAPFSALISSVSSWQHLRSHLARLDDVLEERPEPAGDFSAQGITGAIELQAVVYRYDPGSPPAVDGITLRIEQGEKVAIVGPTGSGKSTLARLLLGMLQPVSGRVLFDGRSTLEYDLQSLRARMGAVPQEVFLVNDTLRANITLLDPTITDADVEWAIRLACLDEVVKTLPQGLMTPLGENGSTLSGGQRQRVSLARALARHPAVLLMDEATSSLDLETEELLHANLAEVGCTRIVIAHRLATVKDADRILVMENGRLVDEGTWDSLVGRESLFTKLVAAAEVLHAP